MTPEAILTGLSKSRTKLDQAALVYIKQIDVALVATEQERDEAQRERVNLRRELDAVTFGQVSVGERPQNSTGVILPPNPLPPSKEDPAVPPKVAYDAMVERARCAAIVMGPIEAAYTIQEWDAMTKGDAVQNVRVKAAQLILAQPAPKVTP